MLPKTLRLSETSSFIVEWLKSPMVTASVIPSSRRLADNMVKGLHPNVGTVVELGPGTGVFTESLLTAGIPESALILIELNRKFANNLKEKYPQATVINGAAEAMSHLPLKNVGAVVSGLPFLSMKDRQIDAILEAAFAVLDEQGVFIQFTYGHRCPVKSRLLTQHGLLAKRNSTVLNNFPPASVYHLQKKPRYW